MDDYDNDLFLMLFLMLAVFSVTLFIAFIGAGK